MLAKLSPQDFDLTPAPDQIAEAGAHGDWAGDLLPKGGSGVLGAGSALGVGEAFLRMVSSD